MTFATETLNARNTRPRRFRRRIGVIAGAFCALAVLSGEAVQAQDGGPDFFKVSGVGADDPLNIRSGPGAGNRVVAVAPNGAVFRNLGCRNNWCHVETADGRVNGWASARYLVESGGRPTHHTSSGDDGVPEVHVRRTGEYEVRFAAGCTVLFNPAGRRLQAGSTCSRTQLSRAGEAVERYRREQGDDSASVPGGSSIELSGTGTIYGGGVTKGRVFGSREGHYTVFLAAAEAGLVCTGALQHAPANLRSQTTSVHCNNGVDGTVTMTRTRNGNAYTLTFTLTDGSGGFVIVS